MQFGADVFLFLGARQSGSWLSGPFAKATTLVPKLREPGAKLRGGIELTEDPLAHSHHVGSCEDHLSGCRPCDAANSDKNGLWTGLRTQPFHALGPDRRL